MKKRIDTVCWDADNMLWDWISMHLAGMRSMAIKIASITGASDSEVKSSMARVYDKAGTFDYKPLVQEMDVVEHWATQIQPERERIRRVIDLAFAVHASYTQSRNETFRMYEGVPVTLAGLKENGVRNVIVSDAPISKIVRRVKHFDIDQHFDLICGRPDAQVDEERTRGEESLRYYEDTRRETGVYNIEPEIRIMTDQKKPDVNLAQLLGKTPEEVTETVGMAGDNFNKDIGTAFNNGCYGFYARNGAASVEAISGLHEFASPSVVTRNATGVDLSKENIRMIQSMGEKLRVVDDVREILKYVLAGKAKKPSTRP